MRAAESAWRTGRDRCCAPGAFASPWLFAQSDSTQGAPARRALTDAARVLVEGLIDHAVRALADLFALLVPADARHPHRLALHLARKHHHLDPCKHQANAFAPLAGWSGANECPLVERLSKSPKQHDGPDNDSSSAGFGAGFAAEERSVPCNCGPVTPPCRPARGARLASAAVPAGRNERSETKQRRLRDRAKTARGASREGRLRGWAEQWLRGAGDLRKRPCIAYRTQSSRG